MSEVVEAAAKFFQVLVGAIVEFFHFPAKAKGVEIVQGGKGVPVSETEGGKLYAILAKNKCPDCGKNTAFLEGPSGGISTNIFCAECGAGFNVTPMIQTADRIGKRWP